MEVVKDTSTQNLESPKTPVAYLDDEVKTDAYSDDDTIPNIDDDTQIPAANVKVIDTGNDAVETSTDLTPETTKKSAELKSKSAVLKIQTLNYIEIGIWRNTVGCYYQFSADPTPSNVNNTSVPPIIEKNDEQPISLRGRKGVDYTLRLTSDLDSEVETDKKKPKNIDHVHVGHLHSDS